MGIMHMCTLNRIVDFVSLPYLTCAELLTLCYTLPDKTYTLYFYLTELLMNEQEIRGFICLDF